MSEFQREALKNKYGGLPSVLKRPGKSNVASGGIRRKRDYSPLSWEGYFETSKDVRVSEKNIFRVYQAGSTGPLLLLLHGGGHSALSWAVFTRAVTGICYCQVLAIDLRGHGDTTTEDDYNLSADALAKDVKDVVDKIYKDVDSKPKILLVGHSMGGAIAVHVGAQGLLGPSLIGLAVIDVVEGTAIEALSSMQTFLKSRPSSFSSLEEGIEWSVRIGQIHNVESARISMVGQLIRCKSSCDSEKERCSSSTPSPSHFCDAISEESDETNTSLTDAPDKITDTPTNSKPEEVKERFKWRIDLSKTDQFWKGWFQDMSKLFLSCRVPKLLILAGIERLDRELTIGQMQGQFQLQVLSRCGHSVHEDAPDKVAEVLVSFLLRLKLAQAKENFHRPMPAC